MPEDEGRDMKFSVISCDPPWGFSDTLKKMKGRTKRSAQSHYGTMSVDEIAAIDVSSVTDPNCCVLALWVPSSLLPSGFRVMETWGFSYKQNVVWGKTKQNVESKIDAGDIIVPNDMLAFGMGHLFRQCHEIALIGTRGRVYETLSNNSQRSVVLDSSRGHSVKTEMLQDSLEMMYPEALKLEMFARRDRQGWVTVGNEAPMTYGVDINDAIQKLALM